MTQRTPSAKVVTPFRLTPSRAEVLIREAARDSDRVIFSEHAAERMGERDFTDLEVLGILRTGTVLEEPEKTGRGEWKCKVLKKLRGAREAGVVTIILLSGKLWIKTVEWEDWRS